MRITCLLISSNRLWIGTSNGVIISVPLSESGGCAGSIVPRGSNSLPGAGVRVPPVPGSFVPYCTMAHAQLSFHGHRDNVKFFVAVPGNGGKSFVSRRRDTILSRFRRHECCVYSLRGVVNFRYVNWSASEATVSDARDVGRRRLYRFSNR